MATFATGSPDVHEVFFQVFDKGWMEDDEGRLIEFRNCVIILTSGIGSEWLDALCRGGTPAPEAEVLVEVAREPLL
ncbi:AAA family ATPase [Pseudomonas sp. D(2018)]|uniref:AAA family ATPase n=1 Tax=Pseudomonadaceae TaxID=135621 RepID=UPI001C49B562|nr:AAA family ATPase [Pseudomonas sp. D(2018)]